MEVVGNEKLLCNYEVYSILKDIKAKKRLKDKENVATIAYETCKYLEQTLCVHQSSEVVRNFLLTMKAKGFNLSKAEKLQILNQRPTTEVNLRLLIEENEERFTEEAIQEMLEVVTSTLPTEVKEVAEEETPAAAEAKEDS